MTHPTDTPDGEPEDNARLTEEEIAVGFDRVDTLLRELAKDDAVRELLGEHLHESIIRESPAGDDPHEGP